MVVQGKSGEEPRVPPSRQIWITVPIAVPASLLIDDDNLDWGLCTLPCRQVGPQEPSLPQGPEVLPMLSVDDGDGDPN